MEKCRKSGLIVRGQSLKPFQQFDGFGGRDFRLSRNTERGSDVITVAGDSPLRPARAAARVLLRSFHLMSKTVTLEDAKTHLEELIERARQGEELLIAGSAGQPLVKLVLAEPETAPATKRWEAFGMLKGQIEIAPDFDEPLDEFKPYME